METKKIRILVMFGAIANGGVEHIITDIFKNIDSNLFETEAVYHGGAFELDDVPLLKELWPNMERAPEFKTVNALSYRKWWKNYIKRHKHFDIIHLNYIDSAFSFIDLFTKERTLSIAHAHNPKSRPYSAGQFISDMISFPARYKCDHLVACSHATAEDIFGKKKANSSKCSVMLNGIDLNRFNFNKEKRNMMRSKFNVENKTIIGHVGRFAPQKNHDFIIDVFYEYQLQNPNSELWLIGEGQLQDKTKNKVASLNIANKVRFLGITSDVDSYLNAFDLFLFPSTYEGLGIVLVEAQATGLICLSSKAIPIEAEIDFGLISKLSLKESPKTWSNKINQLITQQTERKDGTLAVHNKGFDIKDNAKWAENLYKKLLNLE